MLGRALLERKLNKAYLLNFFYMFYCDLFKKNCKMHAGGLVFAQLFFSFVVRVQLSNTAK